VLDLSDRVQQALAAAQTQEKQSSPDRQFLKAVVGLVAIHAYVFRVDIACRDKVIASHARSYGREEEMLEPHHYLPVLLRKPGAFARATPIMKWPLPPVYETYHRRLREDRDNGAGTREYIRILMLLKDHGLPEVTAAVEQAAGLGLYGYDAVLTFFGGRSARKLCAVSLVQPNRVGHFDLLVSR
jgi:hypothetical protein